ncbi:DNA-deoxyinosine glycosylase [Chitinibacter tainanensis]|uniref:DNA-deoxyinosine glycosylase n=1 Tax=Chitinibacter tainanensis TaxID=230667 RepID=UPI0023547424|nr:DNA-deoxyinosine glycosylase [Chitinibacter tainanensis]
MSSKSSFAPIWRADARILILGSLPGDASLAAGEYYAHPRNAFWPIMSALLGQPLHEQPFPARYAALQAAGIALWDVVAQAQRRGSLDSALREINPNPLAELIAQLPQLQLVVFNGQAAAKHGQRYIPMYLASSVAPSSSPAYTLPLAAKLAQWQALIAPLKNHATPAPKGHSSEC